MSKGPIRTLHFTNAWHPTSGGIATFYRALIVRANERGQQLSLVVPGDRERIEQTGPSTRIYYIAAPTAPLNPDYRIIYPNQFLWPGSRIQQIIHSEKPDLIEVCDKYCFNYLGALVRFQLIGLPGERPVVIGFSCERMDENVGAYLSRFPIARWFSSIYMRWLYFPMFDHHLANSVHTAAELRVAAKGHAVRRGVWIQPMGVTLDSFSPGLRSNEARGQIAAKQGIDPGSRLLLYAGRLVPEKNLCLLLDTLEALTPASGGSEVFHLLIAGQGMEQKRLEAEAARRLPGRVHFLGHIAGGAELARLYSNCDVFVHPNPREPFGIAPLEAMASGLPLVAPDCGGITTYANGSNAWLAPADPTRFSSAIRQLLDDPDERHRRTAAARATAASYRWELVADGLLDLYRMLATRGIQSTLEPTREPLFWSDPPSPSTARRATLIANLAVKCIRALSRRRRSDGATVEPEPAA